MDVQGWQTDGAAEANSGGAQGEDSGTVVSESAPVVVQGRFNEHTTSGSRSRQILPERQEAPAIVLPDPEEAVRVLGELAAQNQRVQTARKRLEEAQALVKARRTTVDEEVGKLERLLTSATAPAPLPLFDAAQSEADLRQMEAAIDAAAPEAQDASEAEPEGDVGGVEAIDAPAPANANGEAPAEVF